MDKEAASPSPAAASPTSPVEVRPSPLKGGGRSLHATRPFAPGAVIAAFTPLLLLPSLARLSSSCAYCLRPGEPRACTRCRAVSYCDAACQAADWRAGHGSAECKALQRAGGSGGGRARQLPTPVRALLRALVKEEIGAAMDPLEGHVEKRRAASASRWGDLQMMAMGACSFAGKGTGEEHVRRAVDLLCKIETNAFQRHDSDTDQAGGIFLEPTLAMANHSCMPNALVQFIGRKAILRAETQIQAGDEILISYTDYTLPLFKRKEALSSYMFECRCPRCQDDLNIYQACAAFSNLDLNRYSLVPDLSDVRHHSAVTNPAKQAEARALSSSVLDSVDSGTLPEPLSERLRELKRQYNSCQQLADLGLWAESPLPQILTEVSIYYAEDGDFASALAVACHVATACDPYRYPAPFHPLRVKGLLMIAKLLANTAADAASATGALQPLAAGQDPKQHTHDTLRAVDQVSLCEMLLFMVLRYAPDPYARDWDLVSEASSMLADIERLPGREKELSLINAWKRDPLDEQSQAFFDFAVVRPTTMLASLGQAILKAEF